MAASSTEQPGSPAGTCVFCGIVRRAVPAQLVGENDHALAFLTLRDGALAPGHCLVIPKEHCQGVHDASPTACHAVIDLCHDIARSVADVGIGTGTNLLSACGPGSDQSVSHWHIHLVPRTAGDGITTWPEHDSPVTEREHSAAGRRLAGVTGEAGSYWWAP